MSLFLNVTKNEFSKLLSRKKYIIFFIIEIIFCVVVTLIQMLINRFGSGLIQYGLFNMPLFMLNLLIQAYIPLIIFMASSDLYATEFGDLTLRASLIRPVSRLKIFLAKALAVMSMVLIYLAALFLLATALQASLGGGFSGIWRSFGAYILDIFPLCVLVLMAALLNQFTKSGTLSMLMSILIYVVLCAAGLLIPQVGGLLFTGYSQWHNLWIGETLPIGALLAKTGLLAGYAVIFLTAGYYLFDRRDM